MKLSPSSANAWVECPGMIQLQKRFPAVNPDTTKSEEGRLAHWLAAKMILGGDAPAPLETPEGVVIEDEMRDAASVYVEALDNSGAFERAWEVEHPLEVPLLSDRKGVVDFYDFDESLGLLTVWDFKYGHTPVEVMRNYQLFLYASSLRVVLRTVVAIRFAIVQPRAIHPDGPVRFWSLTDRDYAQMEAKIIGSASAAYADIPPTVVGMQCKECTARHACGTLQKAPVQDWAFQVGCSETNVLTPQGLSACFALIEDAEKVLKALKSGIVARIEHMCDSGVVVPGYEMASIAGRLRWSGKTKEIEDYGDLYGVDVRKPAGLITPIQAKKAGFPEEVLGVLAVRGSTRKLVRVNSEAIKALFGARNEHTSEKEIGNE